MRRLIGLMLAVGLVAAVLAGIVANAFVQRCLADGYSETECTALIWTVFGDGRAVVVIERGSAR